MYRNTWLLPVFYALRGSFLYVPIIAAFLATYEAGLMTFLIVQGVTTLTQAALEIPTGSFADNYGRKFSLFVGAMFSAVGMGVYAVGTDLQQFLIAAIVMGVGGSLMMGADSALLFETYRNLGKTNKYDSAQAHASAIAAVSEATCSLICGALIVWFGLSFESILWLQTGIYGFAAAATLLLVDRNTASADRAKTFKIIADVVKRQPRLWAAVVFSAAGSNMSFVLVWLTPAYYLAFSGLQIGYGSYGWLYNVIWAIMLASIFVWKRFVEHFKKDLERSFRLFTFLTASCYLVLIALPGLLAVMFIIITYFVRANVIPLTQGLMNRLIIDDSERATVISFSRTIAWTFAAFVWLIAYIISETSGSLLLAMAFAGVVVVTASVSSLWWLSRLGVLSN